MKMQFIFSPLIHRKKIFSSKFNDVEFMDGVDKKIKNWFKVEYYVNKIWMILIIPSAVLTLHDKTLNYLVRFFTDEISVPKKVLILASLILILSLISKALLKKSTKFLFITVCEKYENEVGDLPEKIKLYITKNVVDSAEADVIMSGFITRPLIFRKRFLKYNPTRVNFAKNLPPEVKRRFYLEYFLDLLKAISFFSLLIGAFLLAIF